MVFFSGTVGVVTMIILFSSLILNLHVGVLVCLGGLNPLEKHSEKQNPNPMRSVGMPNRMYNGILSAITCLGKLAVSGAQQRKTEPPP